MPGQLEDEHVPNLGGHGMGVVPDGPIPRRSISSLEEEEG
jgi:hypothetical protein